MNRKAAIVVLGVVLAACGGNKDESSPAEIPAPTLAPGGPGASIAPSPPPAGGASPSPAPTASASLQPTAQPEPISTRTHLKMAAVAVRVAQTATGYSLAASAPSKALMRYPSAKAGQGANQTISCAQAGQFTMTEGLTSENYPTRSWTFDGCEQDGHISAGRLSIVAKCTGKTFEECHRAVAEYGQNGTGSWSVQTAGQTDTWKGTISQQLVGNDLKREFTTRLSARLPDGLVWIADHAMTATVTSQSVSQGSVTIAGEITLSGDGSRDAGCQRGTMNIATPQVLEYDSIDGSTAQIRSGMLRITGQNGTVARVRFVEGQAEVSIDGGNYVVLPDAEIRQCTF